jgi:hypothetical protein
MSKRDKKSSVPKKRDKKNRLPRLLFNAKDGRSVFFLPKKGAQTVNLTSQQPEPIPHRHH